MFLLNPYPAMCEVWHSKKQKLNLHFVMFIKNEIRDDIRLELLIVNMHFYNIHFLKYF